MLPAIACDDGIAVRGEACFTDEPELLAFGFTPIALRVAPFDSDGIADVLVTGVDTQGAVLGVVSRTGADGALGAAQDAGVYGCSAHPALGDANLDGATDLLVDACDDTMMVFVASGSGSFAAPVIVDVDVATRTSTIFDVNSDGVGDVVALGIAGEAIALTWAAGDGLGGYAPPLGTFVGQLGAADEPLGFSIGLLDADGLPDVVLSHADPTRVPTIARGTGAAFAEPVPWDELPIARGVAAIDVVDGADPELLIVRSEPPVFEVWQGPLGSAKPLAATTIEAARDHFLAAGDVDGDGSLDLAFFDPATPNLEIWLNDGDGRWAFAAIVDIGANVDQLAIADLDGDGAAELIAGTFAERGVSILRSAP